MNFFNRLYHFIFIRRKSPVRKTNVFVLEHRMILFLVSLTSFIIFYPVLHQYFPHTIPVLELFGTIIIVVGVYIISENKQVLTLAILLALLILTIISFNVVLVSMTLQIVSLCLEILFFVIIVIALLAHVFRLPVLSASKIYGAICCYLLIGLIWALIYTLIEYTIPLSFVFHQNIDLQIERFAHPSYFPFFIYYSFITLATLGYGDIVPLNSVGQVAAVIEAIIGQLYIAVLIARLVGSQIAHVYKKK